MQVALATFLLGSDRCFPPVSTILPSCARRFSTRPVPRSVFSANVCARVTVLRIFGVILCVLFTVFTITCSVKFTMLKRTKKILSAALRERDENSNIASEQENKNVFKKSVFKVKLLTDKENCSFGDKPSKKRPKIRSPLKALHFKNSEEVLTEKNSSSTTTEPAVSPVPVPVDPALLPLTPISSTTTETRGNDFFHDKSCSEEGLSSTSPTSGLSPINPESSSFNLPSSVSSVISVTAPLDIPVSPTVTNNPTTLIPCETETNNECGDSPPVNLEKTESSSLNLPSSVSSVISVTAPLDIPASPTVTNNLTTLIPCETETNNGSGNSSPVNSEKTGKKRKARIDPAEKIIAKRKALSEKHPVLPFICTCKRNCLLNFNEERRSKINIQFWELNWCERKNFILHLCSKSEVIRRRQFSNEIRKNSFSYFLMTESGKLLEVCKGFFLTTLGFKPTNDRFVHDTLKVQDKSTILPVFNDGRGKAPSVKRSPWELVDEHIESFHPVISHYRREHAPNNALSTK